MTKTIKKSLQIALVIYTSFSLVGCATGNLLSYAKESAKTEKRDLKFNNISFATIRDNRYVSICAQFSDPKDPGETIESELTIDLKKMSEQLNQQPTEVNKIDDKLNVQSSECTYQHGKDIKTLPIHKMYSYAPTISQAIKELDKAPRSKPEIILLSHGSETYLAFGAPESMYPGLNKHVLNAYEGTHKVQNPYLFLLLPVTVAFDAAVIYVTVILYAACVLFPPACIPVGILTLPVEKAYEDH